MKTRRTSADLLPLLDSLAGRVQQLLAADPALAEICADLARLGHAPLLVVEAAAGGAAPRVVCAERRPIVPEWSDQDAEVLRSVGIASDRNDPDPPQPRRRQPR